MTDKPESDDFPPLMASSVMAGFPSPAEQYIDTKLDLNRLLAPHAAATFFVRASGDSMTGVGIHSGDILVVDRSLEAVDGSIVIAAVDNDFTVKRLRKTPRRICLESANPEFADIELSSESELRLFGVVTAVIHRFVRLK
ncbi:MAG: translesion error-prone DNA polymerase V autoproteolytic subunit [Lentisphaerae bacterium]|jgi:DNA polymerase V|nr:translesion error-prone DNA polymerase V autoproteolytic subunit [Lentisphaerota bacterium]